MKEIKIQKLALSNFKGCGALTLDLGGKNASICGDNATGKTTVYDALTWLLFGKDSRGGSDQEIIKPLDRDGNVKDHEAITCVEAELTVVGDGGTDPSTAARSPSPASNGGYTVTLRKEMQECWVTRRGSSTAVYDGNEFRYAIDGVPLKKNEFQRRVGELVDEDVFRMLTSVTAFAFDLPWRKRREILYELSGVQALSDRAMLLEAAKGGRAGGTDSSAPLRSAQNDSGEVFAELADQIGGGSSLDDLKKVLLARRKGLLQTRDQTPARIDELNKQLAGLQIIDFAGEAELLQQTSARIQALDGEIAIAKNDARNPDLERRTADLRTERSTLEAWKADELRKIAEARDAVQAEIRALYNKNLDHRREQEAHLPNEAVLRREMESLEQRLSTLRDSIADKRDEANGLDRLVDAARAEWVEVSNEAFTDGTCPTCGQELPLEMLEEARKKHEARKAERLAEIQARGNRHLLRAQDLRAGADNMERDADELRAKAAEARTAVEKAAGATKAVSDLEGYRDQMDAMNRKLDAITTTETMAEYQRRLAEIQKKQDAINAESRQGSQETEDKLKDLTAQRAQLLRTAQIQQETLGKRSSLAYLEGRISELKEDQRRAVEELGGVDRLLFGIEAFIRWKTHYIEDSINGLFRIVTFRLFREQANGGLEERCDVVVNGVPYAALNNGARINAGMDIIRRLAEHYGVRVPLFVDNAESVTRLEDADTQVIRLVVSEQDKALRVEVCGDH